MPAVRKTLESMRLHWNRSRRSKPRSVGELISQQPFDTFLVYGVFYRHAAGDVQRIERLARGVRVGHDTGKLAPAPVRILRGFQCFHERRALTCRGAGIG